MQQQVEVKQVAGMAGLFARARFRAGEVIVPIGGVIVREASRYSLQVAEDEHIVPPPEVLACAAAVENYRWCFMNHACRPNVRIDAARRVVVATKSIGAGDELRFDYDTTEWDMAEPFGCRCGAPDCRGLIRGFRHLPPDLQQALAVHAAPHLLRLRDAQAHPAAV